MVDLSFDGRVKRLVGSWRAARARRRLLNGAAAPAERRIAVLHEIARLVADADQAWRAYLVDATKGRNQSVIETRPAPRIGALERLEQVAAIADDGGIALDGEVEGRDRLSVPKSDDFAPDILSPTMMNMTAAALAQAKAEGQERARRRHRQSVEFAERFGPPLAFAEAVLTALAIDVAGPARPHQR